MPNAGQWLREGVAQLKRFGEALVPPVPDASPGTHAWMTMLDWDLEQAQRNETDLQEVLFRRQRRIRRARDGDARWAESLALARVEAASGRETEARSRFEDLMGAGTIPDPVQGVFPDLTMQIATSIDGAAGRAMLDAALAVADAGEHRRLSHALLTRTAEYERARDETDAEFAVLHEGLRRLGLGRASDPYRSGAARRSELEDWEREAVLWTGQRLLVHASRSHAFEAADQLLVDLRAVLEGQPKLSTWNAGLLRQEGWLAYLRGDFERARDAWSALHDLHGDTQDAGKWVVDRLNLGFAHLRVGDFEVARRLARAIIDVGHQGDDAPLHRAHALTAEAALASGDLEAARAHAAVAAQAADGIVRSAGRRVLAELRLAADDTLAAVTLARQAVEDFDAAAEGADEAFVIDRLLTLVRCAAEPDPEGAWVALRRAQAIALPATHPFARDIERARAKLNP